MAGHSQFKNIMHRKGKRDAIRAKLFAKFAREITVAAKTGVPDPEMNPRLRLAIQEARAENMPKENIERAIKKALGSDLANYESQSHRRRGPERVHEVRRQSGCHRRRQPYVQPHRRNHL